MKMPAAVIHEEISKSGAISFARFMELALYCPESGYYERNRDIVGARGDFITSVSSGSLFGELLAFQFAAWRREGGSPGGRLQLVEAGAHDGKLAADILCWLRAQRPELFSQVDYVLVEPSAARQDWQRQTLAAFAGNVSWIPQLTALPGRTVTDDFQIFFSNELLDAFPVQRFGWDARGGEWFESGVAAEGEKFVWTRLASGGADALPESVREVPPSLLAVLPDGYTVEASPAAAAWWRAAAGTLRRGKLLTIDYGYTAEEQFSPARTRGTLRSYARQQIGDDLLATPGEQDLTAHVNFSAIQKSGEDAGLTTELFAGQPQFLTRILQRGVTDGVFAQLSPKQIRQFQTLTHPDHLGRAFRVLVQSR
ncbi:MAG TPA: SAM-dependent methyltransferase [Verrucomicrobiae bacterium]